MEQFLGEVGGLRFELQEGFRFLLLFFFLTG